MKKFNLLLPVFVITLLFSGFIRAEDDQPQPGDDVVTPAIDSVNGSITTPGNTEVNKEEPKDIPMARPKDSPNTKDVKTGKASSLKDIISEIADKLNGQNNLTAGNLAEGLKKQLQIKSPKSTLSAADLAAHDKEIENNIKKIEDLEKAGPLTIENLVNAAVAVFNTNGGQCSKEKILILYHIKTLNQFN